LQSPHICIKNKSHEKQKRYKSQVGKILILDISNIKSHHSIYPYLDPIYKQILKKQNHEK